MTPPFPPLHCWPPVVYWWSITCGIFQGRHTTASLMSWPYYTNRDLPSSVLWLSMPLGNCVLCSSCVWDWSETPLQQRPPVCPRIPNIPSGSYPLRSTLPWSCLSYAVQNIYWKREGKGFIIMWCNVDIFTAIAACMSRHSNALFNNKTSHVTRRNTYPINRNHQTNQYSQTRLETIDRVRDEKRRHHGEGDQDEDGQQVDQCAVRWLRLLLSLSTARLPLPVLLLAAICPALSHVRVLARVAAVEEQVEDLLRRNVRIEWVLVLVATLRARLLRLIPVHVVAFPLLGVGENGHGVAEWLESLNRSGRLILVRVYLER